MTKQEKAQAKRARRGKRAWEGNGSLYALANSYEECPERAWRRKPRKAEAAREDGSQ